MECFIGGLKIPYGRNFQLRCGLFELIISYFGTWNLDILNFNWPAWNIAFYNFKGKLPLLSMCSKQYCFTASGPFY